MTAADATRASESAAKPRELPAGLRDWLQVEVADQSFGLAIAPVEEILSAAGLAQAPGAPFPVRGVLSSRDRSIPVVDLGLRMGLGEARSDGRVVVVLSQGRRLGLLVDRVERLVRLEDSSLRALPSLARTPRSDFIYGVYRDQDRLLLLLDLKRTLLLGEDAELPIASGERADGSSTR